MHYRFFSMLCWLNRILEKVVEKVVERARFVVYWIISVLIFQIIVTYSSIPKMLNHPCTVEIFILVEFWFCWRNKLQQNTDRNASYQRFVPAPTCSKICTRKTSKVHHTEWNWKSTIPHKCIKRHAPSNSKLSLNINFLDFQQQVLSLGFFRDRIILPAYFC